MALPPRKHGSLKVEVDDSPLTRRLLLDEPRYIRVEELYGLPLLLAAVLALLLANSSWREGYLALWQTEVALQVGDWRLAKTLHHWINDGLLALFFLVIGVEIKRELVHGQLATWRLAALPVAAAVGGMVVPAALYIAFNLRGGDLHGWGVTVATDIAFALAVLSMLKDDRLAPLRVLVLAFATADDIGGVLVIAIAYSQQLQWISLIAALVVLAGMFGLLRARLRSPVLFVVGGLAVWMLIEQSGVHAAIAGVLLGVLVPTEARMRASDFARQARPVVKDFEKAHRRLGGRDEISEKSGDRQSDERREAALGRIDALAAATQEPAERITQMLNPWVSYAILPLFALANAGVVISVDALRAMVTAAAPLGIVAGLLLGKPIGFLAFGWIAVRTGLARLPEGVDWRMMAGGAVLAGIGFTVSLFIAELAFKGGGDSLETAKLAVLGASVIAALAGYAWLRTTMRNKDGGRS